MSPPPVWYAGSSPVPIAPEFLGDILAGAERSGDLDALVERQEPAGNRRLSFSVPQIDRKLVVSSPEGSAWRPHWADALAGVVTAWKICAWSCCEIVR